MHGRKFRETRRRWCCGWCNSTDVRLRYLPATQKPKHLNFFVKWMGSHQIENVADHLSTRVLPFIHHWTAQFDVRVVGREVGGFEAAWRLLRRSRVLVCFAEMDAKNSEGSPPHPPPSLDAATAALVTAFQSEDYAEAEAALVQRLRQLQTQLGLLLEPVFLKRLDFGASDRLLLLSSCVCTCCVMLHKENTGVLFSLAHWFRSSRAGAWTRPPFARIANSSLPNASTSSTPSTQPVRSPLPGRPVDRVGTEGEVFLQAGRTKIIGNHP